MVIEVVHCRRRATRTTKMKKSKSSRTSRRTKRLRRMRTTMTTTTRMTRAGEKIEGGKFYTGEEGASTAWLQKGLSACHQL